MIFKPINGQLSLHCFIGEMIMQLVLTMISGSMYFVVMMVILQLILWRDMT